jgi:hypothetical protein
MMTGDGIINEKAREPSRKMVAEWLVDVYNNMPEEIGENSWRKTGFEWF